MLKEEMTSILQEEKKIKQEVTNLIDENRIVNFSDAIFAFAATLLVLKLDLPALTATDMNTQFLSSLTHLAPQYFANLISFFVIGYYWLNHHAIFALVKRFNMTLVWLNILFLALISFLPFPVDLYGDYMTVPTVVVFYSASLAIAGFMLAIIWWYAASKHRLISRELGKREINYYLARTLLAPIVFTVSMPWVLIHPLSVQVLWVLVIIGLVVINHTFKVQKMSKVEEI